MHLRHFVLGALIATAGVLSAEDPIPDAFVTVYSQGSVNWVTGEVLVTGSAKVRRVVKGPSDPLYNPDDPYQPRNIASARLAARREAEIAARANAEIILSSLRVDNETTVADHRRRPGVDSKFNAFVSEQGALSSALLDDRDDSYKITLTYRLFGPKGFVALNDQEDPADDFIRFHMEAWPTYWPATNKTVWDGLIISAPYLHLTPALAPRIYAENGNLLYDASFIDASTASENGMTLYASTPFNVIRSMNMRYYHCLAVNTTSFEGTDLVISDEDAARICSSQGTLKNLRKCRVIILAAAPPSKKR
jgi:hypothetical protein